MEQYPETPRLFASSYSCETTYRACASWVNTFLLQNKIRKSQAAHFSVNVPNV